MFFICFFWVTLYRLSWAKFLILLSLMWMKTLDISAFHLKTPQELHPSSGQKNVPLRQNNGHSPLWKLLHLDQKRLHDFWGNKNELYNNKLYLVEQTLQALCLSIWGFWGLISVDWGLQNWFIVGNVDFFFNWKDGLATYVRIFSVSPDIQAEVKKKNSELPLPQPKEKKKKKEIDI